MNGHEEEFVGLGIDRELGLDVRKARSLLATAADPAIALQVALTLDRRDPADPTVTDLRQRVHAAPRIARLFARQQADGSWGDRPDPGRRILPTLWLTKILTEIGVTTDHPGLVSALDFLEAHAIVDGGVSMDGRRDGVLSCYTGILTDTLLRAGRTSAAVEPLTWICTYQQVRYGGHDFLGDGLGGDPSDGPSDGPSGRPIWGDYLAKRYGGCLASTTCLIGLAKCGLALTRARDLGVHPGPTAAPAPAEGPAPAEAPLEPAVLIAAISDLLSERELFRRRDGSVIPLGARPDATGAAAERWLGPAFPLSYQTDLIEVATLAAEAGVPLDRIRPALRRIAGWRSADGGWPMLRSCSASTWYQPERPSKTRSSHWITLRVIQLRDALRQRPDARVL